MRFMGHAGSRVDIEAIGTDGLIVSVTEVGESGQEGQEQEEVSVARVVLDGNHAEALAHGILAACKELRARAVSL